MILSTAKGNPKLKDLFVRPNIIAKRVSGSLEAHANVGDAFLGWDS
ncbi:unnamed protein product [Anisakis simplex]|uniref:Uncharacterized protein n=1 Tax=Anisakis simplex TaxID=6269 RepID=A0A3P6QQJ5_ANISI|nr:unnamed protein product [Anisakis simplex]